LIFFDIVFLNFFGGASDGYDSMQSVIVVVCGGIFLGGVTGG
jgi:hypothetical protein